MPAISKHGLDSFSISPLHYWTWNVNPNRSPKKDTPASLLGSAIHTSILEPERFETEYMAEPAESDYPNALVSADDYKQACKKLGLKVTGTKPDLKASLKATAGFTGTFFDEVYDDLTQGKRVLKIEDMRVCKIIAARVRKHPTLGHLFKDGLAERSMFWKDPDTGVLCRARPDWLVSDTIVDVKSTKDASPSGFQRSIMKYRYHVQAAFYMDGLEQLTGIRPDAFVFAAWEKISPYASGVYYAQQDLVEAGRKEYKRLLVDYARCLESDTWPGYSQEALPIGLPEWYKSDETGSESERDWLDEMENG